MIVSAWSMIPISEKRSIVKKHLQNAVEYAISEGGRVFLSEKGTDFTSLLGEVIGEYSETVHMHIEYSDDILSKIGSDMIHSRRPTDVVRSYMTDKADLVIIFEPKDSIAIRGLTKTTLRIKI